MSLNFSDVLRFWFGAPDEAGYGRAREEWFRKDAAFDTTIRERFGSTIETALAGGLREWDKTPEGALARVIVLDQFTRNAFRDSARAFAGDGLARSAAQAMVERGDDRKLLPVQRQFAYLPLEHAEDLAAQELAVRLFEQLAREEPAMADAAEWARKHYEVIRRFGRFPHRNELLGRPSSPAEIEFLQQPRSRF